MVYRYAPDGTYVKETSTVVRLQSEAAVRQYGVLHILYASNTEQVEILYVRVRKPDGTAENTPLEDAQAVPVETTRQAPMYSDINEKQIPIRSLGVGDRLEFSGECMRLKAQVPG